MSNISRLTSLAAAGSGGPAYEIAYSSTAGDQLVSFSSGSISQISTINNASTNVLTYSTDGSYLITGSLYLSVYDSSVEGTLSFIGQTSVDKAVISLDMNSAKTRIATGHDAHYSATAKSGRLFSFSGSGSPGYIASLNRTEQTYTGTSTIFRPDGGRIYYGQTEYNNNTSVVAVTIDDPFRSGSSYFLPPTIPYPGGVDYGLYLPQGTRTTGMVFDPATQSRIAVAVQTSVTHQPNLYILNASANPNTNGFAGIIIGSYGFTGSSAANTYNPVISWSPDGNYIAYVLGGDIYLFDVSTRSNITLVDTFDISVETGVNAITTSIDFSPDGLYLVVGCRNATIGLVVLDHSTPGSLSLSATYDDTGTVKSVKFKPIVP